MQSLIDGPYTGRTGYDYSGIERFNKGISGNALGRAQSNLRISPKTHLEVDHHE
jgi:hypothetical protein